MKRLIEEFSDREIQSFINRYHDAGKTEGGIFTLAELHVEKMRRFPAARSPREIFKFIVEEAAKQSSGTVTYGRIWEFLKPDTPWQGNHSVKTVGSSLGAVISYCVRNNLPLVSTLVVQKGTGRLSPQAIQTIYDEAKLYGLDVGLIPAEFVEEHALKARQATVENLPNE